MPLLLFTFIAVMQWLVISILPVESPFDHTLLFIGNLQILAVAGIWQLLNKYIKFIGDSDDTDSLPPIQW